MADIKVPQKDGSISVAVDGGVPTTRHVNDHVVAVADDDVPGFLAAVPGSEVVKPTKK